MNIDRRSFLGSGLAAWGAARIVPSPVAAAAAPAEQTAAARASSGRSLSRQFAQWVAIGLAGCADDGLLDLPGEMVNEAVVAEQKSGPFGAKGVGETGTFGVSPAIANAIHDALGVRLTSLPMNPEAVFMALEEKK